MDIAEYVDEATAATLKDLLPNVPLELERTPVSGSASPFVCVKLPPSSNAEYRFVLALTPERQILAEPVNVDERFDFWYRPFEDAEFSNSIAKLDKAFFDTVALLVSHDTRIVQTRGILSHTFQCDYKAASGWVRVYRYSALRLGGFRVPPMQGSKRIYYSPPLCPPPH